MSSGAPRSNAIQEEESTSVSSSDRRMKGPRITPAEASNNSSKQPTPPPSSSSSSAVAGKTNSRNTAASKTKIKSNERKKQSPGPAVAPVAPRPVLTRTGIDKRDQNQNQKSRNGGSESSSLKSTHNFNKSSSSPSSSRMNPGGASQQPVIRKSTTKEQKNERLIQLVLDYLREQQHTASPSVSLSQMGGDLRKLPFPDSANTDAATGGGGGGTSNIISGGSCSCLQVIKEQHGGIKAFLEKFPQHFCLTHQQRQNQRDMLVSAVAVNNNINIMGEKVPPSFVRKDSNNGTSKSQDKNPKNQRLKMVNVIHERNVQKKETIPLKAPTEQVKVAPTSTSTIPRDDRTTVLQLQKDLAAETMKRKQAEVERRKLLASEKGIREQLERTWKVAKTERERIQMDLSRSQQELTSEMQKRKQAEAETRKAETLLEAAQSHREQVERLWKDNEAEFEQTILKLQLDLEQAQEELEQAQQDLKCETVKRLELQALQHKTQLLLDSANRHPDDMERLLKEAELEVQQLQTQVTDEIHKRKQAETEKYKMENLLAQAKNGTARQTAMTRKNKEIQNLQDQLNMERRKNNAPRAGALHPAASSDHNKEAASITDFIAAKLPVAPARILKRADFPSEPPKAEAHSESCYDGSVNKWVGGGSGTRENSDLECRDAELMIVSSSYSKEDVRIVCPPGGCVQVIRFLTLLVETESDNEPVTLKLQLSLQKDYPSVPLEVEASLSLDNVTCSGAAQMRALDALPGLVDACRSEAEALVGSEAILDVLSTADQWIGSQSNRSSPAEEEGGKEEGCNLDNGNDANEDLDRRAAELLVVTSFYSDEELRVLGPTEGIGIVQVTRSLSLSVDAKADTVTVELQLSLPKEYPETQLTVEARLADDNTSCSGAVQKCALDAIPGLVDLCRCEAQALAGSEATLQVLSAADEWVLSDWAGLQNKRFPPDIEYNKDETGGTVGLCCMLIYTHHIADQDTIHFVQHAASKLDLVGFIRTGKPGFFLVEGLEENCQHFLENLFQVRTKIRSGGKRGSNSSTFCEAGRVSSKNGHRAFPKKLSQLEGKDGLEEFRKHCEQVGLLSDFEEAAKRGANMGRN